jgi:hypothetical protein
MNGPLEFWLRIHVDRLTGAPTARPLREDVCLPNPRCVTRESLAAVQHAPDEWVVAPKTDGIRTLVVRGVFMGAPLVALVGRRYTVRVAWQGARSTEEDGVRTVLDAEATRHGALSVHDAFVVGGVPVHARPHRVRMDLVDAAIAEVTRGADVPPLTQKPFAPLCAASVEAALAADGDGLILAHAARPATFGSDPALLKWKAPERCTIDLVVERRRCGAHYGRKARARAADSGRIIVDEIDVAAVPGDLPAIWEFASRDGRWQPLHRRDDKAKANSLFVVEQTMRNVVDVIRAAELYGA